MFELAALCGYCGTTIVTSTGGMHFAAQHPGLYWIVVTWPDGEPALFDPRWEMVDG